MLAHLCDVSKSMLLSRLVCYIYNIAMAVAHSSRGGYHVRSGFLVCIALHSLALLRC